MIECVAVEEILKMSLQLKEQLDETNRKLDVLLSALLTNTEIKKELLQHGGGGNGTRRGDSQPRSF